MKVFPFQYFGLKFCTFNECLCLQVSKLTLNSRREGGQRGCQDKKYFFSLLRTWKGCCRPHPFSKIYYKYKFEFLYPFPVSVANFVNIDNHYLHLNFFIFFHFCYIFTFSAETLYIHWKRFRDFKNHCLKLLFNYNFYTLTAHIVTV